MRERTARGREHPRCISSRLSSRDQSRPPQHGDRSREAAPMLNVRNFLTLSQECPGATVAATTFERIRKFTGQNCFMLESKIQPLPEQEAIEQIVETVERAEEGTAPFALVLGSGFSQGLVPTAWELVTESLPLWMKSLNDKTSFETQKEIPVEQRVEIAREFWRDFVNKNASRKLVLDLDLQTGLPVTYSDAYKAIFTAKYNGAVGEPAEARKFQRALMRLDKPRLNAAHFLLASLLGVQPGKSRKNDLFKARAAFSRLILTTNFDPFLQTALQAVNRLYFMSDTPELGVSNEILDDETDAIHLVYLHGTVHRRLQAATDEDIQALKERNARTLAPVLERHGVIVLGYSGWDDAVVEALAACNGFDHRLYWCGLEADPLTRGAFGPRVAGILRKSSAIYVQTTGAGRFMARLVRELVNGLPRLLDNPIAQVREMLETIDLGELKNLSSVEAKGSTTAPVNDIASNSEVFVQAQDLARQLLLGAEQDFFHAKRIQQLLSSARVAAALGNHDETLKLCNEALSLAPLEPADLADLLLIQGLAHYFLGDQDKAISSWSQIAELPGAPVGHVARALVNRGIIWGQKGETEKELADYTHLIEQLPDAPVDEVAAALRNRGVIWGQKGETEKELADYTHLIEQLPGAPAEHVAVALRNRAVSWIKKAEIEKALADYTHLIEQLPGAPLEEMAVALRNRGVIWGQKGDTEKALADYTHLIEQLPGAPSGQVAAALGNRGVIWGQKGDTEKALADYTRLIEQLPGAPVEDVAAALRNRGVAWGQKGETENALADFTRVIEQLPGAPVEQIAKALVNRGLIWGQKGETEKELADYTRVIEQLPGAPVEQIAKALVNRGVSWGQKGETEKALADFTRVIEQLPGAPVEEVEGALVNRGVSWGEKGETEKALADYTRVIEQLPSAPVEHVAVALRSRADSWNQKGETEKALADYTRVIEQLPGAPLEEVAAALGGRGWTRYLKEDFLAFLADTEAALRKLPSLDPAAFNLGLALLAVGRDVEALEAYRRAGERFPQSIDTNGLADLEEAKKKWLGDARAQPAIQLLQSLKK
ncbi:MAG: hypothetical protein C5B58_03210 [Acidobacteria bacterium]|nr:MAG: hypothetical protein C5B58_03210 [Acidobacteriota bacterium]